MKCSACGFDLETGANFCPNCGAQVVVEEEREITAKFDSDELKKSWEERANKARGITVISVLGAKTDLGCVRENNEDKFEFFIPEDEETLAVKGAFYAVADGMGGHNAGQIASELALKNAIKAYYADSSPIVEESLRSALQQANGIIYEASRAIVERSGMGTTMTALVIRGEEAFIAQVGDSRCYRLRDGKIEQMTNDHSWVGEQVRRGALTEEEAQMSPFRNVITRSLGNAPSVEIDIYNEELKVGDEFLLCSDGLSGEVSKEEMRDAMKDASPSSAASALVDLALDRGGHDNTTVLILAIRDIIKDNDKENDKDKDKKRKGLSALFSRG